MDNLDFISKPEKLAAHPQETFDSAAALEFFQSAGKEQRFAANEVIFSENQKSDSFLLQRNKMYLLLEGSIALTVQDDAIGTVNTGEIFGEMASLTQMPRSATATATTACRVISLDDRQFKNALREHPEFALTLMLLMTRRLRKMLAELKTSGALARHEDDGNFPVLGKGLLAELADELGDHAVMRYEAGKTFMQEGQSGVFMYIVLEGRIHIQIQNHVVEEIGTGGIFGEMALLERTERLASAVADSDCAVLAINRATFLNLIQGNPEFGLAILGAVGERLRFMVSAYADEAAE